MQHPAATCPAPAPERPTCGVCNVPVGVRGYGTWIYYSTCSRCERPVCYEHIADSDGAPDGTFTHCSTCVAELRAERDAEEAKATTGLSRFERIEAFDQREEERERYDRDPRDR